MQDSHAGYRPHPSVQTPGIAPLQAQHSTTVGSASSQHVAPRVVSIRAGQGPADPETHLTRTKTPFASGGGQSFVSSSANHPGSSNNNTSIALGYQTQASGSVPYTGATPAPYTIPPDILSATAQNPYGTVRSSPHQQQNPTKGTNDTPPIRAAEPQTSTDTAYTSPPYAKFDVYRSPGPTVAAEVTLPGSQQPPQTQFVTVNTTTVKDLAAKFPLNEDVLTSASSSTLNAGTGRSAQGFAVSGAAAPQVVDLTDQNVLSGRSALPESWLSPSYSTAPYKSSGQPTRTENDAPIPIPAPRGPAVTPAVDSRGHSQPVSASHGQQTLRPQANPPQTKSAATSVPSYLPAHLAQGVQSVSQKGTGSTPLNASSAYGNVSSNSPARSTQQPLQRSPSTINAVPPGGGTPKQSSFKLKSRNGSSDTVVYPVTKPSPTQSVKPIAHRTSNTNLQANASARPDMNPTRLPNAPAEYPDMSRYRSPQAFASATYNPTNPPHSAPITGSLLDNYSQSAHLHHSRSASQPVVQSPYDYIPPAPRGQTLPGAVPPSPAAAPSASAIAAAYRSGLYSTDNSARALDRRVPPRAAPSPAPSSQLQYLNAPPPLLLSKTGYTLPNGVPQQSRGQTSLAPPATGRANGSVMQGHSRSQSDAQNPLLSGRVAISGHPSTPAPTKAQLTSPSEQELLMTPSSLAPSMLKGGNTMQAPFPSSRPSPSSQPSKPPSTKDVRKKGGLFGLFRSRSSPPKQDARVAEAIGPEPAAKPRQRSTSQTTINAVAASVRNIIAPHPNPSRSNAATQATSSGPRSSLEQPRPTAAPHTRAAPPLLSTDVGSMRRIAPVTPQQVLTSAAEYHVSGKSSGTKMFTPFRLISRRHRTVSAASNEAADGTAVSGNVLSDYAEAQCIVRRIPSSVGSLLGALR